MQVTKITIKTDKFKIPGNYRAIEKLKTIENNRNLKSIRINSNLQGVWKQTRRLPKQTSKQINLKFQEIIEQQNNRKQQKPIEI